MSKDNLIVSMGELAAIGAAGVIGATDGQERPQIAPDATLTYKGHPATLETIERLRAALRRSEDEMPVVTQEDLDAFAQLNSSTDPMREAMLGYRHLGSRPDVLAAVFCAMGAEVRERIFGWSTTADCFCRIDRAEQQGITWDYDPKVVRFIYDAVKAKLEAEALPETLEHSQVVGGHRLTITMRRLGAKDYQVEDVSLSPVEAF